MASLAFPHIRLCSQALLRGPPQLFCSRALVQQGTPLLTMHNSQAKQGHIVCVGKKSPGWRNYDFYRRPPGPGRKSPPRIGRGNIRKRRSPLRPPGGESSYAEKDIFHIRFGERKKRELAEKAKKEDEESGNIGEAVKKDGKEKGDQKHGEEAAAKTEGAKKVGKKKIRLNQGLGRRRRNILKRKQIQKQKQQQGRRRKGCGNKGVAKKEGDAAAKKEGEAAARKEGEETARKDGEETKKVGTKKIWLNQRLGRRRRNILKGIALAADAEGKKEEAESVNGGEPKKVKLEKVIKRRVKARGFKGSWEACWRFNSRRRQRKVAAGVARKRKAWAFGIQLAMFILNHSGFPPPYGFPPLIVPGIHPVLINCCEEKHTN